MQHKRFQIIRRLSSFVIYLAIFSQLFFSPVLAAPNRIHPDLSPLPEKTSPVARVPVSGAHAASDAPAWSLVWSDEFNGSSVNTNDWNYEVGNGDWGWGNNELEYYTSGNNTSIQNGQLVIEARKEDVNGYQYTSTRMTTKGKHEFEYGKLEARMALPSGQGLWPAFWMLGSNFDSVGWPASGEINIMEHKNIDSNVYGAVHWDSGGQADYSCISTGSLDVTQFHIYDIEWDAQKITWHVDGTEYCRIDISNNINSTDEFHQPFFFILNLAVGGKFPGNPDASTVFPARMYVDYLRVYAPSTGLTPPVVTASDGTDTSGVNVSWTATSGATSYVAYRSDSLTGAKFPPSGYAISGLAGADVWATPGVVYYYWVKACNATICSDFGIPETGSRGVVAGLTPPVVTASDGLYTDRVKVSWTTSSGATYYVAYRSDTPTGVKLPQGGFVVAALEGADIWSISGVTYYYWVKACNPISCSDFSAADTGWR